MFDMGEIRTRLFDPLRRGSPLTPFEDPRLRGTLLIPFEVELIRFGASRLRDTWLTLFDVELIRWAEFTPLNGPRKRIAGPLPEYCEREPLLFSSWFRCNVPVTAAVDTETFLSVASC